MNDSLIEASKPVDTMRNPFKGLHSYEEKDQDDFSGRELDESNLFSLVTANAHVMVYGKSGIGKTSLLHAGLFPTLRKHHFLPVSIRLNYSSSSSLKKQIIEKIQEELKNHDIREMDTDMVTPTDSFRYGEILWKYFQRVEYVDVDGKSWTIVLVLDQFEEIFTIGRNHPEREKLPDELYSLVENKVKNSKIRVVLGLREDYLPQMDWLKEQVPSLSQVTFRVCPLNEEQARLVMSIYPDFQNTNIQDNILYHFYTTNTTVAEVEPSILSLLCYQMYEKGITSLSEKDKDTILSDFYDEELRKIPNSQQLAEFIETKLLTDGGFRTPFYLASNHPLRGALEEAVNRRILRKVYYGVREYVEIIHDVLVPVIKQRMELRLKEKQVREENLRRRQMLYKSISLVGLLFIFLGIYAFIQKNRADTQYQKALSNGLAAQSSLELPSDNIKAIRIAETAYKIGLPEPSPSVQQVLTTTAYSTSDRPFYTLSNQYEDYVSAVTYSPKGTKILTLSLAGHAKLFDMEGKLLTDFSQHAIKINTAVFSPDGNYLITLSMDNMARLWDLKGNLLKTLNMHTDKVWGAVFSPDSSRIVTFSDDKTAKIWDLNGRLLADLNKHTARVSHAAFSPIGNMIVTSSWDNTAKLWNWSGSLLADLKGHKDYVWSAVFSSDGTRLITASSDKTAKVWDLKGKLLHDLKFTDKVWSAALSNDGKTVLARVGNTAKLCDLEGNLLADLQRYKSDLSEALFSPTGSKILTSSGNSADLWDLKGTHLAGLGNQTDYISKVMFYNNDAGILTCSGNTVKLWDLEKSFVVDLNKSMGNVRNALFSPDRTKIITWSANTAKLFDLKGNQLAEFKQHTAPILSVAFSPDNSKVLTGSWDNTAKLWNLKGNLLTDFNRHPAQVSAVAF
ncbi:MAG TPA: WD40 repeat domain-containing protein, partial [Candidatus Kapabacteria bacterium]|nr:WD40 repeat domain-containing protein [Candidatus Kapabacteria bacterium]